MENKTKKIYACGFKVIPKKIIIVKNVKWDCEVKSLLPKKLVLNYKKFSNAKSTDELEDMISNYISFIVGFCHDGFNYEIVEVINHNE